MMKKLLLVVLVKFVASLNHFQEIPSFKFESMKSRPSFALKELANVNEMHELVFCVKQMNLDVLTDTLLSRSTPGNTLYQHWLNFDEVGELTSNINSSIAIKNWLTAHDVFVHWESIHHDYIKANATVSVWQHLLNTTFYLWEDQSLEGFKSNSKLFIRATEYFLPVFMIEHVSGIFNTVQVPPKFSSKFLRPSSFFNSNETSDKQSLKASKTKTLRSRFDGSVTIDFLNSFYDINSNLGSSSLSQSFFQTSYAAFSQTDLTTFQNMYGLTVQAVINKNGLETSDCSQHDCIEGNVDTQYGMGIAQQVVTIYWYTGGSDPFVDWITEVANESNPPTSNSISWASTEQVSLIFS
jgi:hypothetical protein